MFADVFAFYPQGISVWLLGLALLLSMASVWAVWVSLKRATGALLRLLLCLSGIALLALQLAFLMPPAMDVSASRAVVITSCPDAADLLSIEATANVFLAGDSELCQSVSDWLGSNVMRSAKGGLIRISRPSDLLAYSINLSDIRLLGAGFSTEDWRSAEVVDGMEWSEPADLMGFSALDWSPRIAKGSPLTLSAKVAGAGRAKSVSLRFADDDEVLKDAAVSRNGLTTLSITDLPGGRHVLALEVKGQDGDVLLRRSIGVEVVTPPLARILLLQHAPSFEWRALQRWLADSGAEVVVRARISDERYRTLFWNRPPIEAATLDAALLSEFDLVVADGAVFSAMDDAQSALLTTVARDFGLLVLLRSETDVSALPMALRKSLDTESGDAIFRIKDYWAPDTGFSRLNVGLVDATATPILEDDGGLTVAAKIAGSPSLGFSLLRDSYRMVGAGRTEDYARLWSTLIASLAKPVAAESVHFAPLMAEQAVRLRVCKFGTTEPALQTRQLGSATKQVVWRSTDWRPGERCDWHWPDADGWLDVLDADQKLITGHWIAPSGQWQQERVLSALHDTRAWLNAATPASADATPRSRTPISRERILPWLLASALLHWLLQRLVFVRRRRAAVD